MKKNIFVGLIFLSFLTPAYAGVSARASVGARSISSPARSVSRPNTPVARPVTTTRNVTPVNTTSVVHANSNFMSWLPLWLIFFSHNNNNVKATTTDFGAYSATTTR